MMIIRLLFSLLILLSTSHDALAREKNYLITGADLLETGKAVESAIYFKKSLENKEADIADTHFLLGAVYNIAGSYAEAAKELKEAIKLQPVLNEGIAAIFGVAYRDALLRSDAEAYKNLPKNLTSKALFLLGTLMRRAEIWDRSLRAYKIAITSEPDFKLLREGVIDRLYEFRDAIAENEGAIREYEELVNLCPAVQNYLALASIYIRKDLVKTRLFINKAIDLQPDSREKYLDIGELYISAGEFDEGIRLANILIEQKPDFANAYVMAGMIYASSGKYEEAVAYYKKALALDSSCLDCRGDLCYLYVILNRWEDALEEYSAIVERFDTEPYSDLDKLETVILYRRYFGSIMSVALEGGEVSLVIPLDSEIAKDKAETYFNYMNRAVTYERHGDYNQAIKMWKEALKVTESVAAYYNLGRLYLKASGNRKETEYYFEKAKALGRNYPDARMEANIYEQISWVYVAYADYQRAITVVKDFLQRYPKDVLATYRLGCLYYLSGDWDDAITMFESLEDKDKIIFRLASRYYNEARMKKIEGAL